MYAVAHDRIGKLTCNVSTEKTTRNGQSPTESVDRNSRWCWATTTFPSRCAMTYSRCVLRGKAGATCTDGYFVCVVREDRLVTGRAGKQRPRRSVCAVLPGPRPQVPRVFADHLALQGAFLSLAAELRDGLAAVVSRRGDYQSRSSPFRSTRRGGLKSAGNAKIKAIDRERGRTHSIS